MFEVLRSTCIICITISYSFFVSYCRIVSVKDISNGKFTVMYNAKEVLSGLSAPIVKDLGVIHL
jgi:hypothetical protein